MEASKSKTHVELFPKIENMILTNNIGKCVQVHSFYYKLISRIPIGNSDAS